MIRVVRTNLASQQNRFANREFARNTFDLFRLSRRFSEAIRPNRFHDGLTAKEYISKMKRADVAVDEQSLNNFVKMWCQKKELDKALEFVEELKKEKMKLHGDSLAALLPLCASKEPTTDDDALAASLIRSSGITSLEQLKSIQTTQTNKEHHDHSNCNHDHSSTPLKSSPSNSDEYRKSSDGGDGSIPDPTAPETVESGYRVSRGLSWMFWILPLLCFILGTWQIYRWDRKQKLKALRATKLAAAVEDLPIFRSREEAIANELRTFRVTGRYLYDHEITVGPRPNAGTIGYLLLTPFLTNTGRVILVNRGWVPKELRDRSQRKLASYSEPEGEVTLEITLRPDAPMNSFSPPNDLSKNQFYRINARDLATALGSLKPEQLIYDNRSPLKPNFQYPQPPDTFFPLPDNHLEYIITWYTLGGFLTWMTYRLRKGEKKLRKK